MLTFVTFDGDYSFDDPIFVTEKAVPRMNLVAQRLCGMPKETELPDSDKEAASVLAKYILEFAYNKTAKVLVEVNMETFLYQDGPKMGQKGERERHKVAFAGYDIVESTSQPSPSADPAPPADDMVDPLADDIPPAPSRQAAQPQQQPQQAADDPFAGDDIPY